jgi:hypothetical protein
VEDGALTAAHGLLSHYQKITATYDVDVDYSRFPREILDFKFVVAGVESTEFLKSFNSADPTPWPRLDLHIQFRKKIFSGFVTVILPTLIITIVALLANYFPHGSESFTIGRAFPLLASCMFSLIALKFVFNRLIPNISYFIRYDLLYFFALVCILTGLLANLIDTISMADNAKPRHMTSYVALAMTTIGIAVNTYFFLF